MRPPCYPEILPIGGNTFAKLLFDFTVIKLWPSAVLY